MTALVLAPAAIGAVFFLSPGWFALLFWGVAALGVYEWAGLCQLRPVWARVLYVGAYAALGWTVYGQPHWYAPILLSVCVLWLGAAVAVLAYPRGAAIFRQPLWSGLVGLWVALGAWLALIVLRGLEAGSLWLLWMFLLVWGADVGAYFAGRAFGRRSLAPAVSPGKTWEGAFGGLALALGVCGTAVVLWQNQPVLWLLVTLFLVVVSIFGDLFESLLKRATGIKDSGSILPGHGGMLDRIDSLLAVSPMFAVLQMFWPFS